MTNGNLWPLLKIYENPRRPLLLKYLRIKIDSPRLADGEVFEFATTPSSLLTLESQREWHKVARIKKLFTPHSASGWSWCCQPFWRLSFIKLRNHLAFICDFLFPHQMLQHRRYRFSHLVVYEKGLQSRCNLFIESQTTESPFQQKEVIVKLHSLFVLRRFSQTGESLAWVNRQRLKGFRSKF